MKTLTKVERFTNARMKIGLRIIYTIVKLFDVIKFFLWSLTLPEKVEKSTLCANRPALLTSLPPRISGRLAERVRHLLGNQMLYGASSLFLKGKGVIANVNFRIFRNLAEKGSGIGTGNKKPHRVGGA